MKSEVINRFNLNIYKNKQAFKQEHAIQDYLTFFFSFNFRSGYLIIRLFMPPLLT
jgi:hypothetical protein